MKEILEDLNKEQRLAVESIDGPLMVIAGAGSGKTRVLTYRVVHLLNKGVKPYNILALTFTNKAAKEMKERIHKLLDNTNAASVWMGTFHSIFARILRIEGHLMGYPSNYTIYDTEDSKKLIKKIIKEQNLDDKTYPPRFVLNRISSAKTNLISCVDYQNDYEITKKDKISGKPLLGKIYQIYASRCKKAAAMDFDDLLFNTNILFRDFPEAVKKYNHKFKYILVDEYQDTNFSQYLILKKLAAYNKNICVVGDDAQSIYSFRGANIENIHSFETDYPDAKVVKLEQNYRSTKNIVNAANSIIKNNKNQIYKEVWTENTIGEKIKLFKSENEADESNQVANSIYDFKLKNLAKNTDFAILYRTNAQSRAFEEALRKRNIAYKIHGSVSFYQRKEIKDLLSYFRLTVNPYDEEALRRVINYPARGIGKTTLDKINEISIASDIKLWDIINNLKDYELNINSGTRKRLLGFVEMINSFAAKLYETDAYDLATTIASTSTITKELYEDKTAEGISKYENIEELLNAIKNFSENSEDNIDIGDTEEINQDENINQLRTLDKFIQDTALLTDADSKDKNASDTVTLMTIHSAKGLEFPYVYIVGLEENLFPSGMSMDTEKELEEERRLFYVALTRAEKQAILSYATTRYKWGNISFPTPSRFISEIDENYIDTPIYNDFNDNLNDNLNHTYKPKPGNDAYKPKYNKSYNKTSIKTNPKISININTNPNLKKLSSINNNSTASNSNTSKIIEGTQVEHSRFGTGRIFSVEGSGSNKKAVIDFNGCGKKTLLLKFAKLKIID